MKALSDPDALRGLLYTYAGRVLDLEAKVAEQAPKVEALKRLEGAEGSICVTDAAKVLNVRPKALFAYLSANKWLYKRAGTTYWIGYQDKIQAVVKITHAPDEYLMVARVVDPKVLKHMEAARETVSEYHQLQQDLATLQKQFFVVFIQFQCRVLQWPI